MTNFDAAIIGAGAAGLMCALTAGQRGRRVLLLDHATEAGAKILISGGGRCNFTNRETAPERFFGDNPHFCRSALARYTPLDFVRLIEKHRIAYHEKTLGQLFCDGSARAVVAMLLAECEAARVELRLGHRITGLSRAERFRIRTDRGDFEADRLVLATGGLSIPKLGATGFAYEAARQFGLPIVEPAAALVPLTFAGDLLTLMRPLSGVSLEVVASLGRHRFREAALFTHRGLSGPAILQISSFWRAESAIELDLLPGCDAAAMLRERKRARPKAALRTVLGEMLPSRLAAALAPADGEHGPPIGEMADRALNQLADRLKRWRIVPAGTEGFAKAEVTRGGVDTRALSSRTMEARSVPGLYVIGEAADVTGWLGGYNFQWAWSSGYCTGQDL